MDQIDLNHWSYVLLSADACLIAAHAGFYFWMSYRMFFFRNSLPVYQQSTIILEDSCDEDIQSTPECTSISQSAASSAGSMVALAVLSVATAISLLWFTVNSMTVENFALYEGYHSAALLNCWCYVSLILVGVCPTAVPRNADGRKRRDWNRVLCFTFRDSLTRLFHMLGAISFLIVGTISNLFFLHNNQEVFPEFYVLFWLLTLLDIGFLFTQLVSMHCWPAKYNWLLILIEAFAFSGTGTLFSCLQLYILKRTI